MPTPREKFQELLKKLFQFDCAELDFGIYRIMNYKRAVIERFIEKDLLDSVVAELSSGMLAQESGLAQQLAEVAAQIRENLGEDALDAEGNLDQKYANTPRGKQYLEIRERGAKAKSSPELESEIFNHLYTFFSRYYDEGDFMSLRRYSKREKYAIPYNGEEVHLHWANSDQYYIKTGENFTDYSYKHGGWTVRFKLRNADVEQNNVKGAKRFFVPRVADVALDAKARALIIPFEYRPLTPQEEITFKSKPQETILSEASPKIAAAAKSNTDALAALLHEKRKDTDGNPVSLLDHHLRTYARKNSSDFFIHKDLKGFLERELDFYLKNEVLNLDELEAGGEARAENWFQMLRAIKAVGRTIIAFVAQIEDFQKRLFEKKKFVTEVHYCVTLDRVPDELYTEITKNKAQIKEWKRLFYIHEIKRDTTQPGYSEPLKIDFLKSQPSLVLDTCFFSDDFVSKLLSSKEILAGRETLEVGIDGTLVCSDNLQALRSMFAWLNERDVAVYIDPPYNAKTSEIIYKNTYKHSSWITMMENRLCLSLALTAGVPHVIAIDENEQESLGLLLQRLFPDHEITCVGIVHNPRGIQGKGFSYTHEYAYFVRNPRDELAKRLLGEDKSKPLMKTGSVSTRWEGKSMFYPILVKSGKVFDVGDVPSDDFHPKGSQVVRKDGVTELWPIDSDGGERKWRYKGASLRKILDKVELRTGRESKMVPYLRKDAESYRTIWTDPRYNAAEYGSTLLKHILGEEQFSFPKSIHTTSDCIRALGVDESCLILDYFGGSGTTAHAVIEMNRTDEDSRRQYFLCEMEEYFFTVLRPRIERVIYSKDWKDGKPVSRQGSSHAFKYMRLESYEDALDNITFQSADEQAMLQLEDYVLSYMLDFETKESETLLNVAKLDAPFDYKLRRHGQDEPLPVDLPETFNYLIGLHVKSRQVYDNKGTRYLVYRGRAEGRETVILWRTITGWGKKEFEADREFVKQHDLTKGAEDIFVNTDSFIPDARSLDPVFKRLMFSEE